MNKKLLKKLLEKKAEIRTKMNDLISKAETEERAFSEEETTQFDALEQEAKDLDETIQRIEGMRTLEAVLQSSDDADQGASGDDGQASQEDTEMRVFADYIRDELSTETRADVNMDVGSNGAVIPQTIVQKIIARVYDICPVLEKSTKYNIGGKIMIPFYDDKNQIMMDYATEFTDLESKAGSFTSINLDGFLAGVLTKIGNSLINNSAFDIVNHVINVMAMDISRFIERELLNGTTGKVAGLSTVTKTIIAASATAIILDEIVKLKDSVKSIFQQNAVFIMHSETLTALRLLKDGDGRYLLNEDPTLDFGYSLLGKPVYVSDNMPKVAADATVVYYGDLSGLATKFSQNMEIQVLRERFATQHATGVVGWIEFDSKVENAQAISKLVMGN